MSVGEVGGLRSDLRGGLGWCFEILAAVLHCSIVCPVCLELGKKEKLLLT